MALDGLIFRKSGNSLVPVLWDDATPWLARQKQGAPLIIEPLMIRNAERAALYHVVCGIVAENHEELTTKHQVDEALRHLAGHFEVVAWTPPNGKRMFIQRVKSIAFTKMKEYEFELFMNRAFELIQSQLLPGVDIDVLRKEAFVRSGASRVTNAQPDARMLPSS